MTRSTYSERGSVLIVAMGLSIAIAICLTSYLALARTALSVSNRSFIANETVNLAEAGLEQALWSFNQANDGVTTAWNSWTPEGSEDIKRKFQHTDFGTLSRGGSGYVNVYVDHYNVGVGTNPTIVAKAAIRPPRTDSEASYIEKYIIVQLARRSYFSTGLVGKNGVWFHGTNTTVDSWISGVDSAASPTPYSAALRRPYGSVAALNVDADVSVQNANIYGYVSVGSSDFASHVTIGSNGIVSGDFSAPTGTRDAERISGDFVADLPNVAVPTPNVINSVSGSVLDGGTYPRAAGNGSILDTIANDGYYYYRVNSVDLDPAHGKTKDLIIRAGYKVRVIIQNGTGGSGTEVVGTGSTSSLTIQDGASLAIYTSGDINLAGIGVQNGTTLTSPGATTAFQIWGTNNTPGQQRIQVAGRAGLVGIVYAPNAAITITGNGDVSGSVVGDTIDLNGNGNFHYDESLANFGGNNPYRVAKWRELVSAADRATVSSRLDF